MIDIKQIIQEASVDAMHTLPSFGIPSGDEDG